MLNVDPVPTLKDFEEMIVQKDFVGAGPYPQARNTVTRARRARWQGKRRLCASGE